MDLTTPSNDNDEAPETDGSSQNWVANHTNQDDVVIKEDADMDENEGTKS